MNSLPLLGRESELRALDTALERGGGGEGVALALVGAAGNGKTALLNEAIRRAKGRADDWTILKARGVESEAELAFGGLLELVRPLTDLIPELAAPQAAAIRGALALAPAESADRFLVAAALLALLGLASAERPLLVVVDDLHWLDSASALAVAFAARRLWRDRIAVLLAARPERHVSQLLEGIDSIAVGPLGPKDSAELVRTVSGDDVPPEQVEALIQGTAGNPLAVLEVARNLGEAQLALDRVVVPLPVAERIRIGVEQSLEGLDVRERRAVLIAAAVGARAPTELVTRALAEEGVSIDALYAAEKQRLVRITPEYVEFDHPLTRSAAYSAGGSAEQRSVHALLARVSSEGTAERAWHLAAATAIPDERAAAALEATGAEALARGAPGTAFRAFRRAAELTPDAELAAERLLRAGGAARLAGDPESARSMITSARDTSESPLVRAEALGLLFQIDTWRAPVATAETITAEAEHLAELDPVRSAQMLAEAAAALARTGSIPQGVALAERASSEMAAQGRVDNGIQLSLLFARVMDARAPEAVEPLVALGERLAAEPATAQGLAHLQQVAWMEIWVEEFGAAESLLDHAVETGRGQAPGSLPMALAMRGELRFRRGDWDAALADTSEAAALAEDYGQPHPRGLALTCQSRIEAVLGLENACRTTASLAAEIGRGLGGEDSPVSAYGAPALGLLELGKEQPTEAIPHLERLVHSFRAGGIREPGVVLAAGDLIEAYHAVGRTVEAEAALAEFGQLATHVQRKGAQAIAQRCRGLLSKDELGLAEFEHALLFHESVDMPFEAARTRLAFGERLAMVGATGRAEQMFAGAAETFERLGAEVWLARARRGMRRDAGPHPAASRTEPEAEALEDLSPATDGDRDGLDADCRLYLTMESRSEGGEESRRRGERATAFYRAGRLARALEQFEALSEAEPQEQLWHRGIMLCHAASGAIPRGLRQYHACRSSLHQRRGEEPDGTTRRLYLDLLARR